MDTNWRSINTKSRASDYAHSKMIRNERQSKKINKIVRDDVRRFFHHNSKYKPQKIIDSQSETFYLFIYLFFFFLAFSSPHTFISDANIYSKL